MRHDAADIAWHTRQLSRHGGRRPSRSCGPVARRSVKACRCWSTRRTNATCLPASAATSTRAASAFWTPASTPPTTAMRSTPFRSSPRPCPSTTASSPAWWRAGWAGPLPTPDPCPRPAGAACHAGSRAFPSTPRVTLRPDEKGQRWLLNISASDRVGLLYCVARVLAQAPHQPATGQDRHPGRTGGRHLPDSRGRVAAQPRPDRDRNRIAGSLGVGVPAPYSSWLASRPGNNTSVNPKRLKSRTRIGYSMPIR